MAHTPRASRALALLASLTLTSAAAAPAAAQHAAPSAPCDGDGTDLTPRARDAGVRACIARAPLLPLQAAELRVKAPRPGWQLGVIAWAATGPDGLTYLLQRGDSADPIVVVDREGNVVRTWGKGMFDFPHSLRIDAHGNVWTTDATWSRVYAFTPTGRVLLEIRVRGDSAPCENSCGTTDVAFAPNGHVFIADGYTNARILEYTRDGVKVNEWGAPGSRPGQLRQPHSIAIDERGILYVADRINARVQRFDMRGRYLGAWTGFGKTHALALRGDTVWLSTQLTDVPNLAAPGWILKVDGETGRVLGRAALAGGHGLAATADGGVLVVPGPGRVRPTWLRPRGQTRPGEANAGASLAITHVNVVDVERGVVLPDRTVLVAGNRIDAVAPRARVRVPAGALVVDGRGGWLIPGLWDMHAHVAVSTEADEAQSFPLFVANGVTGIRDMGTLSTRWRTWRGGPAMGAAPRPRAIVGVQVEGARPTRLLGVMVRSSREGEHAVDSLAALGPDFIKVKEYLPRDTYRAVVERAAARGLPVAGHVPLSVTAYEASAWGQRSFEHLAGGGSSMLLFTSRDEAALRAELVALAQDPNEDNLSLLLRFNRAAWIDRLADGFDPAKLDSVAAVLARNGTYVTPTFAVLRVLEEELRRGASVADTTAWARRWRLSHQALLALRRAGVELLAGSDVMGAQTGAGLHQELQLLVEAGLTPLEALRTATINPARFLGATDSLGTIAAGKLADLVLLDANPLADIANTRAIRAVVANGRLLDRAALDSLLAEAERAANLPAPLGPAAADSLDDAISEELRATGTPGTAIAVVRGDSIIPRAYGIGSVETGAPVTPTTLFYSGGLSRLYTAATILSLAEERKLDLHAPVGHYVTGLHARIASLTTHQLLASTSGLREEHLRLAYFRRGALSDLARTWGADRVFAEPGRYYSGSHLGWALAGAVVEALTGQSFADAVFERVFKPMGMTRTTFHPLVAATHPLAQGHYPTPGGEREVVRPLGSGSVGLPRASFDNAADAGRFLAALVNEGRLEGRQVLSPWVVERLLTSYTPSPAADGEEEGYGLRASRAGGRRLLSANMNWGGFAATVRIVPEARVAVLAMANGDEHLRRSVDAALRASLPLPPTAPAAAPAAQTVPLAVSEAERLAGTYENERVLRLFLRDGRLHARDESLDPDLGSVTEGEAWPVSRLGARDFVATGSSEGRAIRFRVVHDAAGRPQFLVFGGRMLVRQTEAR